MAAYTEPDFDTRVVASSIIGWIMRIEQGQYGGVAVENLFD
jgi:hypothetical protein